MTSDNPKETTPGLHNDIAEIARRSALPPDLISSFLDKAHQSADEESGSGISEESVKEIRQTCQSLGYVPVNPSWRARIYPEKADLTILVSNSVVQGTNNPYFGDMIKALTESASEKGIRVSCSDFDYDLDYSLDENKLPPGTSDGLANKFVIVGRSNQSMVDQLMKLGGSLVFLGRESEIPGTVSVVPDYRGAAKQAIQMLYAHGHRSIAIAGAFYCLENGYNVVKLKEGAKSAARDLEISLTDDDIFIARDWHVSDQPDFISSIRSSPKKYTAVFCLDDTIADSLYMAAGLINISIPEDLSMVGCNDQNNVRHLHPLLSTVHVPVQRLGIQGFEEAMDLVKNGRPETNKIVKMPTTPTLRESIRFV